MLKILKYYHSTHITLPSFRWSVNKYFRLFTHNCRYSAFRSISIDIMLKVITAYEVLILFDSYNSILCVNIPEFLLS